jgi:plastocyanin
MAGRRRVGLLAILLCLGLALVACGSGGGGSTTTTSSAASPDTIVIHNFSFAPSDLTVAPGATVTVKNEDSTAHTVTATGAKPFDTGTIQAGATATFQAPTTPGTYPYICTIHTFMKANLKVS